MMISRYKAPKDDSIFEDLSPIVEDLTISDHEKSDSEKEWDALIQDITNGEDWLFQTHGFPDPILLQSFTLRKIIVQPMIITEYVDDSQEYVEETSKSSLESDEEDYPPIFMNHHKEPNISEVYDDQDIMTDDLIPEPTNTIPKNVGTGFHTFTLDNVKVAAWRQRIQDFYTWMVTKNLVEREKYMILSDIIDIHFQKMKEIYFELGGDSSLKQAFVSSLPNMLAVQAMMIIEDRFKSITITHIGNIRQAICQSLDVEVTLSLSLLALAQVVEQDERVSNSIRDSSCQGHLIINPG
ncbi:hypothetical protein KY284_035631 [Solanum tuberosum]|nr:hypothetical protein KY284_035631 [Solanum tuberosum]